MPALSQLDDEDKIPPSSALSPPASPLAPAPDFRARYATETAGMPTNLAAVASSNLAATDASISKFNAVSRLLPQQPDAPLPSSALIPPASSSSAPSSLADTHLDDIAARRDQIEGQKRQVMARLGYISPGDAGLNSTLVFHEPDPQERKDMLQQLSFLEGQSKDLLQEHHMVATEKARDAHENFARQTHINAANDFTGLATDLADLQKNAKPGTPEFASGVVDIATKHPAGFQTQAGQSLVRSASSLHDNASALEDRSYWQRFGQAFKEASQTARKRGVDVQYDDQGFPSTELTAGVDSSNPPERPDRPPPAAYVKQAAALAEVKAKKDAAYNANPKADLTAHDRNITLEQAKLDAMKETLGMADQTPSPGTVAQASPPVGPVGVSPAVSSSSSPPDLKALAAKALADPNASEAHKLAAKKLLGQ
jgi:hypothetical protein